MGASLRDRACRAVLAFTLANASVAAPLAPAQCQQAHQDVATLSRSLSVATGCSGPGSTPNRPLKSIGESDPGSAVERCTVDQAATKRWMSQHGSDLAKAQTVAGQCDQQACPVISDVPPQVACRCGPLVSPPASSPGNPRAERTGVPLERCTCPGLDADGDGIPDAYEQRLIERFSPHLRFSLGEHGAEQFRPQDPIRYLQQSRLVTGDDDASTRIDNSTLQADPAAVLNLSNLLNGYVANGAGTQCTNPDPRSPFDVDPLTDTPHDGASWADVMTHRNIGIFAHVSRVAPRSAGVASPQDLAGSCPRMVNGSPVVPVTPVSTYEIHCPNCYRIEYYQFFGYNETYSIQDIHGVDYGNHEGDWAVIAVVYDADTDQIAAVSHWAHGYEMRFDMARARTRHDMDDPLLGKKVRIVEGPNFGQAFTLASIHLLEPRTRQENPELGQDNELRLAIDAATGEFSHPVVYVEHGAHEFWPTEKGNMDRAPNHDGNDPAHHYEPIAIPNLGEIEHPLGPAARIVLLFAGSWGHVNSYNSPPPGPALHKSWNWFAPNRVPISCAKAE